MRNKFIFFLLPFLLVILSCGSEDKIKKPSLTGNSWKLIKIEAGKKSEKVIDKPKSYTIRFYDDSTLKVKSDCNSCSGKYNVAGKFIKLNNLDCSKKFCGKNSYDYLYQKFLNDSSSFYLSGNELVLESYKGKLLLSEK